MNLLYDIGKVDIFMNLKILLFIIICINLISRVKERILFEGDVNESFI